MPNLDVSDVLLDPDFMSRGLICTRIAVVGGDNGRPQKTETAHTFNAVVTTNDGDKMDRRADGTVIKGSINIHTRFILSEGGANSQADEIEWQGRKYIVSQVLSNTHFGRGFVKAICILKPITG